MGNKGQVAWRERETRQPGARAAARRGAGHRGLGGAAEPGRAGVHQRADKQGTAFARGSSAIPRSPQVGDTLLHYAAHKKLVQVVKKAVSLGADVHARNLVLSAHAARLHAARAARRRRRLQGSR